VLTQNNPTVIHFWMDNEIIEADNYRFQEEPRSWYPLYTETPGWKILSRVASLCNSAEFEDGSRCESIWRRETIGGNWTDAAILKFCEHNMGNVMEYRDSNKMVAEIPFNSYNKYQVTIHQTEDVNDERYLVAMKGAPEIIWEKCSTILVDGEDKPITKEWKKAFEEAVSELACVEQERCGCQVIGFCDLMLPAAKYPPGFTFDPDNVEIPLQDMRFVGLMCVADPPRSAAPDTVRILRNECGIKVIMITGDHPVTALAIARTLGIVSENSKTKEEIALRNGCDVENVEVSDADAIVVTGEQLRNLVQSELVEIIENCGEIVFARISPDQRISIMEACRKLGLRVAVAGADKEDIPLLKMADVAIAMGIRGDQSAKAAADLVLLDDDIGSIARAVCLTRKLIAGKLKKFL